MLLVNPPWVTKLRFGNPLAKLVQNKTLSRLFSTGTVVWGYVIQANGELFYHPPSDEAYANDRPGEVVFSLDRDIQLPLQLSYVAMKIGSTRNAEELEPMWRRWADYLNAETTRIVGWEVPIQ